MAAASTRQISFTEGVAEAQGVAEDFVRDAES